MKPSFLKSPFSLPAFLGVWLIAALLAGLIFTTLPARPVQAALPTCTSAADGDWSAAATWDCGRVPTSADAVVINDFEVLVSTPQAAASLMISASGVLRLTAPTSLTLNGDLDVHGTFDDHVGGEVIFAAGNQQIFTNNDWVDFSNLSKTLVNTGDTLSIDSPSCDCTGGIHVLGTLKLLGSATDPLLLRSTASPSVWQIWAEGPLQVDYVDVMDSVNVGEGITVQHGSVSNHNTGWALYTPPGSSSVSLSSTASGLVVEGQPVVFTATLTPDTASGTVDFKDGDNIISGCEEVPVTDGAANCSASDLPQGSRSITAVYSGDTALTSSASAPLTVMVAAYSGVTLTSSGSPTLPGQKVTFSAMLMPMNSGDKVTFMDQGSDIEGCSDVAIDMKGTAMCETSSLALGDHSITVMYHAKGNHTDGVSTPLVQQVRKVASLMVQSSKARSMLLERIIFSASGIPQDATGVISYRDDGKDIPGCTNLPLGGALPTCSVSSLVATNHNITVAYSGDSTYQGGVSPALNQVVGWLNIFLPIIRR